MPGTRRGEGAIPHDQVLGIRRLPPHRWPLRDRYELRLKSGDALSCTPARLDELLDARRWPADYWAMLRAADGAHSDGDRSLISWATGQRLSTGFDLRRDAIRRKGPWLVSDEGYRVKANGRAGMDYEDADGALHVDSEMMAAPAAVIYTYSVPIHRRSVVENITRAWLWAGLDVHVENGALGSRPKQPRGVVHVHGSDVQAPQREDVIEGLKVLANPAPAEEPWPDLTAAIHWVVDDTFWYQHDPADDIGHTLRDALEAAGLRELVARLVEVCSTLSEAPDDAYFAHPRWALVQDLARECLSILQSPSDRDGAVLWVLDHTAGIPASVDLLDGRSLLVRDIAYGYDVGDVDAHVTANTDPAHGEPHFFYTNEVHRIMSTTTGLTLVEVDAEDARTPGAGG